MAEYNRIVRFDWHRDRVMRDDLVVRLSGQEKILLRLIVERGGHTCSRDELMGAIWGPRAPLVDELYLTQLIYRLRRSLRPLGLGARIVTVPRAGYRFDPAGLECRCDDRATAPPEDARSDAAASGDRGGARWPGNLFGWLRRAHARVHDGTPDHALALPAMEPRNYGVTCAGATVYLTRLEHALLGVLIDRQDTTIAPTELIAHVWGNGERVDADRLTRLVSRLRRSLQPLGLDRQVVHIRHEGYRFCGKRAATVMQSGARTPRGWRDICRRALLGTGYGIAFFMAALSVCGTALPSSAPVGPVSAAYRGETGGRNCGLVVARRLR
jgi:DNA-binding winged helix-turn-helix (wHTH) protein